MSTYTFLAADGEVGEGASLHDSLAGASATGHRFIDVFVNGKWHQLFKRIGYDRATYSFSEPPRYSNDPNEWDT